ncbi:2-alkenal reductase, partial [Exiguobacterium mexicanum]|nr:2-alkenal reductase [Exiguobacterium mexicanum]
MERNDRPTESNEPTRREDWLDTELGSSEQRQEPSRATQPARPSFVGRMFPGFVGGVIGAVLTGAIAFPFIDQVPSNVSDTNVTSEGSPVQTTSTTAD